MKESFDIAIVGRSCRIPGAASVASLWELLQSGRCAVSRVPADRWSLERLYHPRSNERGRSYTWSAGLLDDIWGFDPAVFGLSPREAEQMDPQQRLLLELSFEALEDAGIKPSALAGSQTGVFVGASALDYGNLRILDSAAADPYFATGNTLSIISNRISYIFDLHGPSFTVDTACSSGLVALNEAVLALQSGRIDTAIVGGVNILASPFGFLSFSQASMLSRAGLCQAFSAKADGYVRAEGGVALVLQAGSVAQDRRIHAMIRASEVNSDGRTSGISLPSRTYQAALLAQVYADYGIEPDDLAFVEAHGTGTRVGDPIEAGALGEVLGRKRSAPLPIGSIKTNIGHMEPASGLAGLLKAMLALEHDVLPASLHFDEPNPDIDFKGLNLEVCGKPLALAPRGAGSLRVAGVNSFGFGGTNAHVVIADPPPVTPASGSGHALVPSYLMLSAQSQAALSALAADYASRLRAAEPERVPQIVAAAGHRRERMAERLVIPFAGREAMIGALEAAGDESADRTGMAFGTALDRVAQVAFVYSGNGSQWAGMGVAAYRLSQAFKTQFDKVSRCFEKLAGWSLIEALEAADLEARLKLATTAQPLLFAVQSAVTYALHEKGLDPSFTLGHSVGEVAAAEAAGILDLETAVRVVHFRSLHQELTFGHGGMAAIIGPREAADHVIAKLPRLEIAALNSPRGFTIAGPVEDLNAMPALARLHNARVRNLDLAYPFHSDLMAPVEAPLLRDLADLPLREGRAAFISTVFARQALGHELDAHYWWRNVRDCVRFSEAVAEAAKLGARVFVEVAPRSTLLSHISDTAGAAGLDVASFCVLQKGDQAADPIAGAVATALARGAKVEEERVFGADPGPGLALPSYPWQRKPYRLGETVEGSGMFRPGPWHPLIGARPAPEKLEWVSVIDTMVLPYLADHCIDGQVVLPGAAFIEMALACAKDWLQTETAALFDLEILAPMHLGPDETREVLCRITPQIGLLEISSRRRLTQMPWQLHAAAKIIKDSKTVPVTAPEAAPSAIAKVPAETVYAQALRSGLQFGPAFRHLARASLIGPGRIEVELVGAEADGVQSLEPARLDSCFHGLILIFAGTGDQAASVPYIPVRFGAVRLFHPGAVIARARLSVSRHDERAIVASFSLLDASDRVIATLQDIRYQALPSARPAGLADFSIVQRRRLACEPAAARFDPPLDPGEIIAAARKRQLTRPGDDLPADVVLLEGWAISLAFSAARALANGAELDVDSLVGRERLPAAARPWFESLLVALERSGLARKEGRIWALDRDVVLPPHDQILRGFSSDHPQFGAELVLASAVGGAIESLCAGDSAAFMAPFASSSLDAYEIGGAHANASALVLAQLLEASLPAWPKDRAMRILQIGHGPLSARAIALAGVAEARLTIFDAERRRLERARLAFESNPGISYAETLGDLPQGGFDLVIAAEGFHRLTRDPASWPKLCQAMASDAALVAIEPAPSLFRDVVFGLEAARAGAAGRRPSGETAQAEPAAPSERAWAERLRSLGLTQTAIEPIKLPTGAALLLTGAAPTVRKRRSGSGGVLIISDGDARGTETASSFATLLASSGLHVSIVLDVELSDEHLGDNPEILVFFSDAVQDHAAATRRLADTCLRLKRCVERLGARKATVWIVTSGATGADAQAQGNVAAGVWAFSRVLANEMHNLDIRRADVAADLPPPVIADRLRELVLSGTNETEVILGPAATFVTRFESASARRRLDAMPAEAAKLERGDRSGMDRFHWVPARRRAPERGEVEIAVEAAGLNFRDVMWGLGLLPDDILENGFAGPTLGLECAGRVTAVGPGVRSVKPGDRVIAFAKGAFATHVTVPQAVVAALPQDFAPEAAATIPVAFLTAFYGLIVCGRLKQGEWVLVHGGAGGVGLAALQIAHWRGARVIATAGSTEKRALLAALGADHVFDSRSGAFADAIREVTPGGVHVVLNSLSGEAMERSIGVLRPFGRFIELGKRDYVTNTHIGLRPFRRNLSYFGVDLDQLLLEDAATAKRLLQDVVALFAKKRLTPLPYRAFDAAEITDAFHLMQQSGHVGKIIIRPPADGEVKAARPPTSFAAAPDKTHLITGGFGGFGLETARFLAERGARHIVFLGRSGPASPAAKTVLAELAQRGVHAVAEALDVTDKPSMSRLFARFGADLPPLAGVIHAAMVLEDAAVANLDAEKFTRVLKPKVAGAELLHHLSASIDLDYFVLFSSATTMIGNPGQAAYVAANGFMEGLARRRRQAGLPALAIAWGAIEDVGVLARSRSTQEILAKRTGVKNMKAQEALTLMAEILAEGPDATDDGVVVLAGVDWGTAGEHLPVLRSPTYGHFAGRGGPRANERAQIDVAELIASGSPESVKKTVSDLIVEEIGRVLRLPREDVNRTKPLSEIGLDSLMAVELALGLEQRFGLKSALAATVSSFTVGEFADHVISLASGAMTKEEHIARSVAERHLDATADVDGLASAAELARQRSQSLKDILQ